MQASLLWLFQILAVVLGVAALSPLMHMHP